MTAQTAAAPKPSQYQKDLLKEAGVRRRPRTYDSARKLVGALPPSPGQAALLEELGLSAATRDEATAAITRYELENPEWAAARRAQRTAKASATRAANRAAGQTTQYNSTLHGYRDAAVQRHGEAGASLDALALLRSLALRLPADGKERMLQFGAMRRGLSAAEVSERIDALKAQLAG